MHSRTPRLLPLLAFAFLAPACGGAADRIAAAPGIESIRISPDTLTLERGSARVLRVLAFTATGEEVASPAATWRVTDPNVASINRQDVVLALRGGVTEVRATVAGRTASAILTVTNGSDTTVAFLEVLPRRGLVWTGDTLALSVTARNRFYELVPSTAVQWSSSRPSVATISVDGIVRGLASGTSTISATTGGVTGQLEIAVEPVSALELTGARLMIPGSDAWLVLGAVRRGVFYGTGATWTSSDSTIASISPAGFVEALRAGTTTVTAVRDGTTYSAQLTVRPLAGRITFIEDGVLRVLSLDDGLVETVPLVKGAPLESSSAAVSPNGRDVAYDCVNGVCVVPLAGGADPRVLILNASSPSWSADGRTVAARLHTAGIAILNVESGQLAFVRPPFSIERPRISPNGIEIAFECDYEYDYEIVSDICITTTLTSFALSVIPYATRVAWSPDGSRLSYFQSGLCTALARDPARCTLVLAPAAGETTIESAWSPGSAHLVVARADGLWIVEPDGANPVRVRRLSRAGGQLGSPSWTPSP